MKKLFFILVQICFISCSKKKSTDNYLLYANHEAPLGIIHLTVFKDSTFEYISRGIGSKDIHKGKAKIINDSIRFEYEGLIPIVGEKAVCVDKYLIYTGTERALRLKIEINNLTKF